MHVQVLTLRVFMFLHLLMPQGASVGVQYLRIFIGIIDNSQQGTGLRTKGVLFTLISKVQQTSGIPYMRHIRNCETCHII